MKLVLDTEVIPVVESLPRNQYLFMLQDEHGMLVMMLKHIDSLYLPDLGTLKRAVTAAL